jgi:hypothetical protein
MRHQWYGDNRDLVKWSVILNLAGERGIRRIVQVAMLPPTDLTRDAADPVPYIMKNGARWELLADDVIAHFRDLVDIQRLARVSGFRIDVIETPFKRAKRVAYFDDVARLLRKAPRRPILVFLDPDTGIAPKTSGAGHILARELKQVYDAMTRGSTILLYQHARRRRKWMHETRAEFADALSVRTKDVEQYHCPKIAHDVALFAVQKSRD